MGKPVWVRPKGRIAMAGSLLLFLHHKIKPARAMKTKILRILKYAGIGFLGLVLFTIFLGIVLPDSDTDTEQAVSQTEELVVDTTEAVEETENEVEKITDSSETTESVQQTTEVEQVVEEPQEESQPQEQYYTVTSVVDGDTIKINMNGTTETLRLIGIDTPETVDPRKPVQCFGVEASNKAKELLSGKQVRIETDSSQDTRDVYGRLLVYIHRSDGLFFNKHMIEEGYAYEYTYNTPYKYQAEFKSAQQSAKVNQKGLWSPNTCDGDSSTGTETENDTQTQSQSSGGSYYTSSHHTAKYYYPEDCSAWQSLSETYLKSFNTLEELLSSYNRTLSPQCD